jgi:hypothetical protein
MRDYVFVKDSIASVSTEDLVCRRLPSGPIYTDLQPHWHKVRVVSETAKDLYVLKRDAGLSCEAGPEQLRLDRKTLEEAGQYHDKTTEMDFYLWPKRFS